MNVIRGIYRNIEIIVSVSVDGCLPCHQLDVIYAPCSSEVNKNFRNNKLVAKAFKIPSKCKAKSTNYYPKFFWSNMEGKLMIQSSALTKGRDITLFDYLNHIFRAIDKVIDS